MMMVPVVNMKNVVMVYGGVNGDGVGMVMFQFVNQ